MKPDFDSLLAQYGECPVPALPGSFSDDVLRRIRQSTHAEVRPGNWWHNFLETALRPALLVVGVSAALTVGAVFPHVMRSPDLDLTVSALDLGVFSSSTQNLPSGLLDRLP